ncbi:hypothetical protein PVA17_11180 [Lysinibacillus sp. CNPSo 3705]|uniref:hypothetical protein n=1 Tax=Lysinibacillus sp. CNPSo 3705 TaxID=3028148 RepID=UPI0023644AA0|nr:hypothetical protein [Lysinibacillus sp. CNPSo 3705]MDD1503319.1 hypothetical protein [Lysinibacillus sp. CNPSo 3705]
MFNLFQRVYKHPYLSKLSAQKKSIEELRPRTDVLWQFICAKAKRQQHGFFCAKAKRQQQYTTELLTSCRGIIDLEIQKSVYVFFATVDTFFYFV